MQIYKKYGMELTKEGLTFVEYAQRIINSNIKFVKTLHGQDGQSESVCEYYFLNSTLQFVGVF
jgi:DNA-binding transcriptional LysR family regulator